MRKSVSIHAPRCRGAKLKRASAVLGPHDVSIHAPRCRGAKRYRFGRLRPSPLFQSTPLVVEGRSATHTRAPRSARCFNPRPSLSRGEAQAPRCPATASASFNPRPSLSRGEALADVGLPVFTAGVSIHAPRCRGAKQVAATSFEVQSCFNPRPSLSRGEAETHAASTSYDISFNPRPSLSRGEALTIPHEPVPPLVSIHAPRCRGAKRAERLEVFRFVGVSIHAPRCRGAKHLTVLLYASAKTSFNPRPSLSRGEA